LILPNMAESYFIKQQFDFWTIPSITIYNSIINLSDQTCPLWINNINKKIKEDYIKFWKDKLSLDGSEGKGNKLRTYRKLKEKYKIEKFLKLDIVIKKNLSKSEIF
jgi:hypothetical protein